MNETNNSADHLASAGGVEAAWLQHTRDSAELRRLCQARDDLRAALSKEREVADGLAGALRKLCKDYVSLLEAGRDRIRDMGGECDPVDVMERSDPNLKDARSALTAHRESRGNK